MGIHVAFLIMLALCGVQPTHGQSAPKPAASTQPALKAQTPQLAPVPAPDNPPKSVPALKPIGATENSDVPPAINCKLPVDRVGGARFSDAVVVISNGLVEVRPSYMPANTIPYLFGNVVRLDMQGTADGAQRQMSGIVIFRGGTSFAQLNDPSSGNGGAQPLSQDDQIFRNSGTLTGQVLDVAGDQVVFRARDTGGVSRIPVKTITYLRSPRAFLFTIYGRPSADMTHTQVTRIAFQTTAASSRLNEALIIGRQPDPLLGEDEPDLQSGFLAPTRFRPIDPDADQLPPLMRGGRPFPNWP